MKYFIITVDTEGDNLWGWNEGVEITTRNAAYLPRFQELCNKYCFIPTWLANWEMINTPQFVDLAKEGLKKKQCEVGVHIHAWNTPPSYELPMNTNSGLPYLIEYPEEIMEKKIISIIDLFKSTFGFRPVTHRAGRWGTDDRYLRLLYKHGIRVDCSVTPYVSWEKNVGQTIGSKGSDYTREKPVTSYKEGIFEVPVSTMLSKRRFTKEARARQKMNPDLFKSRVFWLRPMGDNLKSMKYLIRSRTLAQTDYLEFMIHSSELMPGENPTYNTKKDIEKLYEQMEIIFSIISKNYRGVGLEEYWRIKTGNII